MHQVASNHPHRAGTAVHAPQRRFCDKSFAAAAKSARSIHTITPIDFSDYHQMSDHRDPDAFNRDERGILRRTSRGAGIPEFRRS